MTKQFDILSAARGSVLALFLATAAPGTALADAQAFTSPEEAVAAVISALEAADGAALQAIFESENRDVIFSGDEVADRTAWGEFLSAYLDLNRIEVQADGVATIFVGEEQWPFPVQLVAGEGGWRFDAAGAREEILLRRIGGNELDVIEIMQGYVGAQADYRATDPDGDGVRTFAASILSDAGKRDGLYWPEEPGAPESPIGDFMARAAADGYSVGDVDVEPDPYLGYYYRVLQKQGQAAPGGAMDYMVNGKMVAGHALLAFPAAYGDSGVMSFMVGEAGVIYEADLGETTLEVAGAMESFDPGTGWAPVEFDDE